MTKEELEKEAGEWLKSNIKTEKREGIAFNIVPTPVQIYCAGAEPREKEIKSLGERCLQLQKDKGELTDKIRELERRIASIRGSHRVDVKKLNARIEQVERLKKENAELKEQLRLAKEMPYSAVKKFAEEKTQEQLTKARGLLRAWFQYCIDTKGKTPLQIETAQFLKDSEVEK